LMLPHNVCLGAEKNFVLFSERLDEQPITVDKTWCRHLVAKAILFRRTDKLVSVQNFGGYKANIVTYMIAKLVHATQARIDLERIWREQDISPALHEALVDLSTLVQKILTSPPPGRANVNEWTKRSECWDAVRDLDWDTPLALQAELVLPDTYADDLALVRATSASDWSELATWGGVTGVLDHQQRDVAIEIAAALTEGWDPAGRHVRAGVQLMRHARQHGFRPILGF
jgi:hypothetical protein